MSQRAGSEGAGGGHKEETAPRLLGHARPVECESAGRAAPQANAGRVRPESPQYAASADAADVPPLTWA